MVSYPGAAPAEPPAAGTASWRSWRSAWTDAAYGPDGFWTRERPSDHFATAVGAGPLVAAAVAALLDDGVGVVVDVGAGDGALLAGLAELLPALGRPALDRPALDLVGVDRRGRPPELDPRVRWVVDHHEVEQAAWTGGGPDAWLGAGGPAKVPLLVAHEWLDDLPTTVAVRTRTGWRALEVDPAGHERPGPTVADADAAWLERWWPVGDRAEVGRTRDVAWAGLVRAATSRGGRALAIDYGHVSSARPATGTLLAYGGGRQRRPVPDGRVNLTAGVAVDALVAAGEAVGATTLRLARQSAVLGDPPLDRALDEGDDPLAALVRRSEHAALTAAGRWGDAWWLLQG